MEIVQNFKVQVIGHAWAIDLLQRQQTADRMPQALLLTGPPGVGKSTVARFLAQSLNCQSVDRPCGICLSCRKVVTGNHPDVRIFDGEEAIKIDEIREMQRELSLSPHEGQYRVILLCNFERATLSAANALLKTLEEPAPQVVIVLTATDPGALLATIVSRCQIITLRPLSSREIVAALQEQWQTPSEQAQLLAQLAGGRLGWAVRALADKELLERREHYLQELIDLLHKTRSDRLAYAHALSRDPVEMKEAMVLWLTIWRDLLLLKGGVSQAKIINLDWQDKLQAMARYSSISQAADLVAGLRTALINLERNVNPRLNLEVILLKLPVM